ncbi:MAG TPA: nucleotidyltransferase [Acidothermaceae bacterium]|jgi:hypothetical protein|nr:nucleotidyltransferase [Acidothermaceae bacterium]
MPNTRTTKAAFEAFDEALNLDPRERSAAEHRHREVTDCLVGSGVAADTFLQGSFARKTMPKPLKDVDMIILLSPTHPISWNQRGGAVAAFEALRTAVQADFPDAAFDLTKHADHALQVTFPDLPFTFDLVPALADPNGGEDVFIADRTLDRWERSNPRTLRRVILARNVSTVGTFVHQVRMLKAFRKHQPALLDMSSLVMESIGYAAILTRQSHAQALVAALDWAAANIHGKVLDPTGVDDLSAEWTPAQRSIYAQVFTEAAKRSHEALGLEADGEHDAATEIWQTLLGEDFPAPAPQKYGDALAALAGGSITTAGRAVSSRQGNQLVRPGRSWRSA